MPPYDIEASAKSIMAVRSVEIGDRHLFPLTRLLFSLGPQIVINHQSDFLTPYPHSSFKFGIAHENLCNSWSVPISIDLGAKISQGLPYNWIVKKIDQRRPREVPLFYSVREIIRRFLMRVPAVDFRPQKLNQLQIVHGYLHAVFPSNSQHSSLLPAAISAKQIPR